MKKWFHIIAEHYHKLWGAMVDKEQHAFIIYGEEDKQDFINYLMHSFPFSREIFETMINTNKDKKFEFHGCRIFFVEKKDDSHTNF